MTTQGKVYLLGAGPGDPSLMTLRGKELVERADCLVYDALVAPEILAWSKPSCVRVYVGKRASRHAMAQEDINRLLVETSKQYACVVRLKGGDPYVFGRGGEEADVLSAEKVPFEVVPGISSAIAGPGYAGIPVTHREYCTQFTVFTGHENPDKGESTLDVEGIARAQGTKVMLMGMSSLRETLARLVEAGQKKSTPAAVIQWATTGRQRSVTGTVGTLADKAEKAGLGAPAIVVIGDVVKEASKLDWYQKLPLFGKRIVVTRTREQIGGLSRQLRELGADVIELPTIRITDPSDRQAFAESVVDCHTYDWLIFTSPNGVKRFFEAFFAVYSDIRCIGGARIAAIGKATEAALKAHGLATDIMPKKAVAEELVKEFARQKERVRGIEHTTMLWVHGEKSREVIARELSAAGAIVDECLAYNTVPETEDTTGAQARLREEGADIITFTSSSTVENFLALGIPLPDTCKIVSIGPITTATLHENGLKPAAEAKEHDIPGLVAAIRKLK
ncbi:uroporphyrinogen-III C-methyltransferase [Akkermansia glycaniphila]|uniref:uroporphyrinogen-III C-methyltransferase n=1 Tax=Akkermansia glycaniphila TaxID=1679444 RepID=UPI001C032D79|nr:uroporphyrinogen-III C-methyltransferase [Akkermansia glycaniphila]MBT9449265.1 uroporphyrinogen-III C-methyltransferase [Akkermansia glycaniphila]